MKLIKSEMFGNVQCDLYQTDDQEIWMTRRQIGEALEYENPNDAIKDIHRRHKERLDKFSRVVQIALPSGGIQNTTVYSAKGIYEICRWSQQPKADAFYDWVYELLEKLRRGQASVVPTLTPTEALLQAVTILDQHAKQLKQLEAAQAESRQQLKVLNHRIDSLDAVNVIGDHRQRLNRMVQKYARQKGILFNVAWNDFKQAFNIAYRTNLELLILNFERKTGMKKVTIPQYLAASGKLEDGIRVADKLLNQAQAS